MAINIKHIPELQNLMDKLEVLLVSEDRSEYEEVNEIADYILKNNGKRLRPLLLLTFAKLLGYSDEHLHLACAIEQIHTATLIHDDVIDKSDLRRGKASANQVYGNQTSILFGDYLYTKAFKILINHGNSNITTELLKTVSLMSEGEIKQLMESHDPKITEEKYFNVIRAKTSELFSLTCKMASLLNFDPNDPVTIACEKFGFHLGNAFQITDDIIDYDSSISSMGKNPGDDFIEAKITLPLIYFLKEATSQDRDPVIDLLLLKTPDNLEQRRKSFPSIVSLLKKYRAFEYCKAIAEHEIMLAKDAISIFQDNEYKQLLLEILEQLVNRQS